MDLFRDENSGAPDVGEVRDGGLLDVAIAGAHHYIGLFALGFGERLDGQHGGDRLVFHLQQVHYGLAAGCAVALGDLVSLQSIDLSPGGEQQNRGVAGGNEEFFDKILFLNV